MSAQQQVRGTSAGVIVALAIISVLLIIVPAGIYAGIVLSLMVLGTVLASRPLRRMPRMIIVSVVAVIATSGALIASRTLGG